MLSTDRTQLPVFGGWLSIQGTNNKLSDVVETPRLANPGGGTSANNIVTPWTGIALDRAGRLAYIGPAGGHGSTAPNDNALYQWDANTLRMTRRRNHTSDADRRIWDGSALVNSNTSTIHGAPQADGYDGAVHTWQGNVWVPPSFPGAGSVLGGMVRLSWCTAVENLDTGAMQTLHFVDPAGGRDYSNCFAFLAGGTAIVRPRNQYSLARYVAAGTESTTYSASSFGQLNYSYGTITSSFPSGNRAAGDMPERREAVSLSATVNTRLRYGQAHDAGATNWQPYADTITLTSSDGSHSQFATTGNFLEVSAPAVAKFSQAAPAYDPVNDCLWVLGNNANDPLIKITGLSGSTWTTQQVQASSTPEICVNGHHGRFFAVPYADGTVIGFLIATATSAVYLQRLS